MNMMTMKYEITAEQKMCQGIKVSTITALENAKMEAPFI
jgi:hypothetical protein